MLEKEKTEPTQKLNQMMLTEKNLRYIDGYHAHKLLFVLEEENKKVKNFVTNEVLEKVASVF